MAAAYEEIAELYVDMQHRVTGDPTEWVGFLASACRNYKCPFDEQLLIYAQRPDAVAVTTLETWNKQFHRWVNTGSKGIAVLEDTGARNRLKYYFDISDTHEGRNARPVHIWRVEQQHQQVVAQQMIQTFGEVTSENFADILVQSAQNLTADNIGSYYADLVDCMQDSLLAELTEQQRYTAFETVLHNSTAYMLLTRCGADVSVYFQPEDFFDIVNFNTPPTVNIIGSASSDLAEVLLRETAQTIRTFARNEQQRYDKQKSERSEQHETDHIQAERRPAFPEPHLTRTERVSPWQIRTDAASLFAGAPQGSVHQPQDDLHAAQAPVRSRTDSNETDELHRGDLSEQQRNHGADQSIRPDAVDTADEQLPQAGGGADSQRADLQLSLFPKMTQESGIVNETVDDTAFSMEKIEAVVRAAGNQQYSRQRIIYQYMLNRTSEQRAEFLKTEYGTGGRGFVIDDTQYAVWWNPSGMKLAVGTTAVNAKDAVTLSWMQIDEHIDRMLQEGIYAVQDELDDARERVIREAAETLHNMYRDLTEEGKDTYFPDYHFEDGSYHEALAQVIQQLHEASFASEMLARLNQMKLDYVQDSSFLRFPLYRPERVLQQLQPLDEPYQTFIAKTDYIPTQYGRFITQDEADAFLERGGAFANGAQTIYSYFTGNHTEKEKEAFLKEQYGIGGSSRAGFSASYDGKGITLKRYMAGDTEAVLNLSWGKAAKRVQQLIQQGRFFQQKQTAAVRPKQRFENNIAAIRMLQQLEQEQRDPTDQEREILSAYSGWGSMPQAFDASNKAWSQEYQTLKALLPNDQYTAARASTLTAFYTPETVIKAMYTVLGKLGFAGGRILEPSCGIGNFFAYLPQEMKQSELYGIELDSLTGRIAQKLYPDAHISIQGFEENKLPDDFFDIAVGNVPFGDFKVNSESNFLIHDFFFAKALKQVRSGGVIAFITSKGTMDKQDISVRKYLARRAELLGAIRLPENVFKEHAGTTVTTDIIFLQKREQYLETDADWIHLDIDANGTALNRYFVQHPEMICGEFVQRSGRFGTETACINRSNKDFAQRLTHAVEQIHGVIPEREQPELDISEEQPAYLPASSNIRNFSYAIVNDSIVFNENGILKPASVSKAAENRIRGLITLRDCVRRLIQYQVEDYPEDRIQAEQAQLNALYDSFTETYGLINSRGNNMAFSSDDSYYLLCSLEIIDENTKQLKRKSDLFTKRTIRPHRVVTAVDTASEALTVSIAEKARVDLPFMQQLTGRSQEQLLQELDGVIYRVPLTEPPQYVTADEYLSGNVREKLKTAQAAAKQDSSLQRNAEALEKVIPADLSAAEISVRLGTTWIPQSDIQQFVEELLQPTWRAAYHIHVRYSAHTGDWNIEGKSMDKNNIRAHKTYGTNRASAYKLIEDALNLRDTKIYDYVDAGDGRQKPVLNVKETMAAQAKQERICQEFKQWIWKDPERRSRLVRYYNDTFNAVRPRQYDGSHIVFSGMNQEITLRTHQINAIARVLYGGNTLLAHVVGAGKSFEMIAAAQESKRLGLCQKSMFVVPNHLVGQWAAEYLRLYPSANILVTTKKDFQTENRKKFCARITAGAYDAVIIGHSQFEKIPMSMAYQEQHLQMQIEAVEQAILEARQANSERFTIKQLERSKKNIEVKIKKLLNTERKDDVVTFEELGIDRLFVDESHGFKNLFLYTKMRNVGGIAQTEAQKSSDMFMKCRYLDEITGGKGVIFATGTPISNSIVELYSVQRYLQYDALEHRGLQHFDAWASTFGETITALELAPEGTKYRTKTRFAKFYNLPELMQMFREVADIQTADMLCLPVPKVNYHNIKTKPSAIQLQMVEKLAERAEAVRSGGVDSSVDNMLLITNDGRKLALDQRMIDPDLPDEPDSKVNACVENVFRIWSENHDTAAAQMIFSDLATPKADGTWNVYDDIREKLVARGIPREQIVFIHEAPTDAKKEELFARVRSGDVCILIGSTQKMGAGTNVQDRLKALHNIDCPWRPSDLLQRQGRIERQGNMFAEVDVFRYVTEKTFDAYLYQLVESKQKFISQIMSSKSPVRAAEDVDEVALSFAEVKMLAAGDERIKQKMDLDIQVSRLRTIKQSFLSEHFELEDRVLKKIPAQITGYIEQIKLYQADCTTAQEHPLDENKFAPMELNGMTFTQKADAGTALLNLCRQLKGSLSKRIGSYRGFAMELNYEPFASEMQIYLCGAARHKVVLGTDVHGNIMRINNEIAKLPQAEEHLQAALQDTKRQLELAKAELQQPFPQEDELKEKEERLAQLNIELNLDKKDRAVLAEEPEQEDIPLKQNKDYTR